MRIACVPLPHPHPDTLSAHIVHHSRPLWRPSYHTSTAHASPCTAPCASHNTTALLRAWLGYPGMAEGRQPTASRGRSIRHEYGRMYRIMDRCHSNTTRLGQRLAEVACNHCHGALHRRCGGQACRRVFVQRCQDKDIIRLETFATINAAKGADDALIHIMTRLHSVFASTSPAETFTQSLGTSSSTCGIQGTGSVTAATNHQATSGVHQVQCDRNPHH